jgi:hypothetical protein
MPTLRTKEAVTRLETIQPHQPTEEMRGRARQEALNVVMLAAQPAVAKAYADAIDRISGIA